ncbi:MAG: RNA methyltransferase [Bacilli bacterium]|nr:RNA methyltransferase [Bacilli bacterium]
MHITSINNEYIKEISKLNEKKYRDKSNKYLIEGLHLVTEALKYDIIDTIIIREDFSYETDIKHIIVSNEVMKKLSDNPSIPKIMAIVYKKESTISGNKILLLDRLQDPGNLGTIIRSAVAFNFDTIILSNDTVDLYNSKVLRSTQGMLFNINILRQDLTSVINELKNNNYTIYGTKVDNGNDVKKINNTNKFALIIGNEGTGISDNILKQCDKYLYIKMNNNCESLNAGVAASILMYEMGNK